jgi:hypothetical protein
MKTIRKTIRKKHKKHHDTDRSQKTQKISSTDFLNNCSPAVKGKTPIRGSCFTEPVLQKLKESYNTQYSNHQILATSPNEIWKELKQRMTVCTKEDCWLDVIESPEERKKLDKYLFVPVQPNEWKQNPNTWLSNYDIIAVLKQYEETHPNFKLIGPTPIDFDETPQDMNGECVWKDLCTFDAESFIKQGKTKLGIVFNLDKHNQPGSHWVSLFVDFDEEFIFYMDSAGEKIPQPIMKLVKRIQEQGAALVPPKQKKFYQNYPIEHQYGNTECGMYSLFFIITMLTGKTENGELKTNKAKIRFFKKKRIPDEYIERFRNIYFRSLT